MFSPLVSVRRGYIYDNVRLKPVRHRRKAAASRNRQRERRRARAFRFSRDSISRHRADLRRKLC
jgi:hypothetical protein